MTEVQVNCSNCRTWTNHTILFEASDDETYKFDDTKSALIQCCGCGRVSMWVRHILYGDHVIDETGSDYVLDENGRPVNEPDKIVHEFYPAPIKRKKPTWVVELAQRGHADIGEILSEVYKAVANDQYRLAAMGIRAALEQVMIRMVGDLRTFDQKLDAFQNGGYISSLQRDAMRATLDVGDAAMHRGHRPTEDDLNVALDIVEGVFASIFVHQEKAQKLTDDVPPRARKGRSDPSGKL